MVHPRPIRVLPSHVLALKPSPLTVHCSAAPSIRKPGFDLATVAECWVSVYHLNSFAHYRAIPALQGSHFSLLRDTRGRGASLATEGRVQPTVQIRARLIGISGLPFHPSQHLVNDSRGTTPPDRSLRSRSRAISTKNPVARPENSVSVLDSTY